MFLSQGWIIACYEDALLEMMKFHVKTCSEGCRLIQVFPIVIVTFSLLGMCCALNSEIAFKNTTFGDLVFKSQNETREKRRIKSAPGLRAGVSLVLDMHSNRASFGTIPDVSRAFSVFIGGSTDFPVLKEQSLLVESGREHRLQLSAEVMDESIF